MKMSMTQATLERNAAVSEMAKMKNEFERLEKEREQVWLKDERCLCLWC